MFDYDKYEAECNKIRETNDKFLDLFKSDLISSGLSQKTIKKHLSNVDFYINEYLLREKPLTMENGISEIDMFLGFFFIRKCMWSTPGNDKKHCCKHQKIL